MRASEFTTEDNFGTHPKRPARTGSRHPRGHEPVPRYKTVKDQGVVEGYSNTTFNVDRRKLNVPALIKAGAILVTHPHGEQGWETDNKEDWAFSLLSLYNVLQGGWPSEAKKYIKPQSYKRAEQQINSSAPNLGSDKLVYDGKYNQILWSIKKLGIPDNVAFLDKGQQDVEEGWKDVVAGGAMALGALGAGHAQAADLSSFNTQYLQQVASGEHPRPMVSIDDAKAELQARANGKQQSVPAPAKSEEPKGFSKEYLQKAADPNRFGRYLISVEKAQELLSKVQESVSEGANEYVFTVVVNGKPATKHSNIDDAKDNARIAKRKGAQVAIWKEVCNQERVAEGAEKRCMQCGMKDCKCPGGSCKCKPIAGWIPNKGFKKAMEEAKSAHPQQAAIAIAMQKDHKKPKSESITLEQQFDMIEEMVEQLAEAHGVDAEQIWEDFESVDDHELFETAAWRRKEGKSKSGGLNAKGVASYRRENPGSKLQTAVTTKPSKLKPGSKAAKRRKSFCARMSGVDGPMKKPNGKPTRKALALRKWNC